MTRTMRGRTAHAAAHDDGSISLFAVVVAIALMLIIGLVVDGAGKVQAQQRAQAAAREAARAGGQAIQVPPAVRGQTPTIDTGTARAAAQTYLTAASVQGTVSIQGGTTIVVDTTTTYTPIFLSIAGIGTQSVTGHAEARLVRAVGGVEQ